ncbi:hypothetical protein GCM10011325_27700 [Dyadobacter sediminis]|nr:hypothetical protein GCM10011325_27700 [Dyadobacter sediminis]
MLVFVQVSIIAQPTLQWENTIGGPGTDDLTTVLQTKDGGYMLCGSSDGGAGSDKSVGTLGGNGENDIWIVKISADGIKQWDKTIQGLTQDQAADMIQTSDGGYVIAANSRSGTGADKADSNKGFVDYWIIKLDENGVKQWDRTLGGSKTENAATIMQTSDGGYIIGGSSDSDAGPQKKENSKGGTDYWVVKLSSTGTQEWDRTIGGIGNDKLGSMQVTNDGGFILGGSSNSIIGADKSQDTVGKRDYWIVKLASNGSKLWDKTIGSSTDDQLTSIIQTFDGGYIMTGSIDFSLPEEQEVQTMDYDTWVVKVSANGTKEWDKTIGASFSWENYDVLNSVRQQSDGTYILAGDSRGSIGKDKSENSRGQQDFWLFKLDKNGTKIWDKSYFGRDQDFLNSFQITFDGGYILAGSSNSDKEYDKSEDMKGGYFDFWVIKLEPDVIPPPSTIRINAGGPDFTTATKKTFIADKYYAGIDRTSSIASGDILNTTNDVLYRSGRSSPAFSYNIPVANGKVDVTLHFAETYYGAPGKKGGAGSRQFNVNIEGSRKLTNFDIFTAAGGALRAYQRTFPVTVTDGVLNIDFLSGAADLPRVSAIEVVAVTTFTSKLLADAYVQDGTYNKANFGATDFLDVKKSSSNLSANRSAYLKFQLPVASGITSAKLRIYGHNHENSNNISVHAYGVNNDSWTENIINKTNAPAASTASLGYVSVNNVYKYYEIDVTSYVKSQQQPGDQVVTLLLQDPNNRNTRLVFNSKENGANPPQLIVQTAPVTVSNTREGMEEIIAVKEAIEVNIFPNPASEILNIEMADWHKVKTVELLNSRSDVVYDSGDKPVQSVHVKELPTGIYFVRITPADGSSLVRKVLIGK